MKYLQIVRPENNISDTFSEAIFKCLRLFLMSSNPIVMHPKDNKISRDIITHLQILYFLFNSG